MSSFHVDSRIDLKIEFDLAVRLGEFILNSGMADKQLLALGHRLANMDEVEEPRNYIKEKYVKIGSARLNVPINLNEEFDENI